MERMSNDVFVITGSLGAGKTTAASYISQKYGYQHLSFVDEIWKPILAERKIEVSRVNLQKLGIELMSNWGPEKIVCTLLAKADPTKTIIMDDVRRLDVVDIIRKHCRKVFLVYIDADFDMRYPRLVKRDNISSMEEQRQAESVETETTIIDIKNHADYIILNHGDINLFYSDLDATVERVQQLLCL